MSTSKMRHENKGWIVCHQLLIGIDLYELKWIHIWILNYRADSVLYTVIAIYLYQCLSIAYTG